VEELAEALGDTNIITKATFVLTGTRPHDDWTPLFQTIAIHKTLEEISVEDDANPRLRLPPFVACRFVAAARRSTTIVNVNLLFTNMSNSIFSHFVDNAAGGMALGLCCVHVDDAELATLAPAIQSATGLTNLVLGGLSDNLMLAIMKSLSSCTFLQHAVMLHLQDMNENKQSILEAAAEIPATLLMIDDQSTIPDGTIYPMLATMIPKFRTKIFLCPLFKPRDAGDGARLQGGHLGCCETELQLEIFCLAVRTYPGRPPTRAPIFCAHRWRRRATSLLFQPEQTACQVGRKSVFHSQTFVAIGIEVGARSRKRVALPRPSSSCTRILLA